MQNHTILIGGLDKTYMQKLALYLNERLGNGMRVELAEHQGSAKEKSGESEGYFSAVKKETAEKQCWDAVIGTEAFVAEMSGRAARSIIFSEDEAEDETHIHPYQNRDALYRKIVTRCVGHIGSMTGTMEKRKSKLYVFTGVGNAGQLSAFAALCGWIWSEKMSVLYLDLTECSGSARLLHLQQDTGDLTDLVLALRRKEALFPGGYIGRLDTLDYICPAANPQVLHEMDGEDIRRLLECILNRNTGAVTVLALGTMVCGCEQIFAAAERIFLLSEEGIVAECALEERKLFIQKCTGDRPVQIEEVPVQKLRADTTGSQILYEWKESEAGRWAARLPREKENMYGDNLAGSAEADYGET